MNLLEMMKEAVFDDQANIKDKKPAYSKMKLLPTVLDQLAKWVFLGRTNEEKNLTRHKIIDAICIFSFWIITFWMG